MIIGYIFLIPSILGIIFSLLLLVSIEHRSPRSPSTARDRAAAELPEAGIAEPIVQKVISSQQLTADDNAILTLEQKDGQ